MNNGGLVFDVKQQGHSFLQDVPLVGPIQVQQPVGFTEVRGVLEVQVLQVLPPLPFENKHLHFLLPRLDEPI